LGIEVKNSQLIAEAPFLIIIKIITDTGIMASIVAQNKSEYESFCDSFGLSLINEKTPFFQMPRRMEA
jgi:hypothetical protein